MIATARAGLTVLMLLGFYLLALVQLVAVVAFGAWLATLLPGPLALKLIWPLLAAAVGAVGLALWRAIRSKPQPPDGLPITPGKAPALWDAVRRLSAEVGTRMPDEIRIVPDVNAAVVEQARLLGLLGGRRYLYLGLPLLQGLTVAQLHAVIAHELGHYSGRHTSLGAVAYRGRIAIGTAIERIGRFNPVGWCFKGYARLYLLVDHAVVRRQEFEADRAAVWAAGRAAAGSALREVHVIDSAWQFYFMEYVKPGWERGYAPEDIFGGFRDLLAGRQRELAGLRLTVPGGEGSRWDTHPPLEDRLAAIATAPVRAVAVDDRPAAALLPGLDVVCRNLQAAMVDIGNRTVLSWPELTAAAAAESTERAAGETLAVLHRVAGATAPVNLESLLHLVESSRIAELAQPLFPRATRQELPERMVQPLVAVLALAAVRSGAARWQHSWSSWADLVGVADGAPLDLTEVARLVVVPETVAHARRRLVALGVDLAMVLYADSPGPASPANRVEDGQVLAGFANIKVDNVRHDLLVLDTGLVLIAELDTSGTHRDRLTRLVESMPVRDLIERHRFIPYQEMARARIAKTVPVHAEIELLDGRRLSIVETWTSPELTKDSNEVLVRLLTTRPAGLPAPRPAAATTAAQPAPATTAAKPARTVPDAVFHESVLLDGLPNVKVNDVPHDLLVLDVGLVLIPDPGPSERGRERLTLLLQSATLAHLAQQNWFIGYEDIVRARIVKQIPVRAELELADGRRVTLHEAWTTPNLSDQASQVLLDALKSVGATVGG